MHLIGDAGAAVDAGAGEAQRLGEAPRLLADLLYQLPCWRHDQGNRAITLQHSMHDHVEGPLGDEPLTLLWHVGEPSDNRKGPGDCTVLLNGPSALGARLRSQKRQPRALTLTWPRGGWSLMWRSIGSTKARVLPLPVFATPMQSRPLMMMGSAWACNVQQSPLWAAQVQN